MKLPVTEHLNDDGVTRVFDGRATDTMVAVSPTSDGMRALVSLETAQAPVRHRFAMGGDVALLVGDDEGNVHAFSADGDYLATAETPWAVDAEGRDVPTRYEIDGTALVQIVDHRDGDYTYPITADPWWVVPLVAGAVRVVVRAVSKARAKTKVQAAKAAGKLRTGSRRIVARFEGTMNRKIKPCLAGGVLAFLPLGADFAWEVYEDGTGAMSSRKFTLLVTSSVAGCIGMALGK